MTGRIKSLSSASACGSIIAEDGATVYFQSSGVLAYDIALLSVGQLVAFDVDSGSCPRAVNICVLPPHHAAGAPAKRQESIQLRYLGFEQTESVREYRFQRVSPGEEKQAFTVSADLALFRKHRVGIQEGPALCLRALVEDLTRGGSATGPAPHRALTDRDMLAYVASRPVPAKRPRPKTAPHGRPVSPQR